MIENLDNWFQKLPKWLQEAGRRILLKEDIVAKDIDELLLLCKQEAGIQLSQTVEAPQGIPIGSFGKTLKPFSLHINSMHDIFGINALAPKNPLQFGDGNLTVVYGENAAGKSGYVRILKHASGARRAGVLYQNIFQKESKDQKAIIDYLLDSKTKSIEWKPESGVIKDIQPIAIYDRATASGYVDEENEITFEPWILNFLTYLTSICEKIGELLDSE